MLLGAQFQNHGPPTIHAPQGWPWSSAGATWSTLTPLTATEREAIKISFHSPDIILISIFSLFNNELSIKKDKATHDHQPHIKVCLTGEEWHEVTMWETPQRGKNQLCLFLALGYLKAQQMLTLLTWTFLGTEAYGKDHITSLCTTLHCPTKVNVLEDS